MRRKQEKLKDELKKEILKEIKKEQKLEEIEKSKVVPPVEKIPVEHTIEDIYEIRKSFLKIFLFSVIAVFIIIIFLIDPFGIKDKKTKDKPKEEAKSEQVTETLLTKKDGIIENSNKELLKLFYMLEPSSFEYYLYDSTYLYSKEEFLVCDIQKDYMLYLLTKTEDFQKLILNDFGETKSELCIENGHIKIPIETINEMLFSSFIFSNIEEYPDFIYTHYVNGDYSTIVKFVYSDGYYVSFCIENETNINYNSIAKPIIKEAIKKGEYITINAKVAFMTKDKVYADYALTKVISNNSTADVLEYINDADEYQYIFKLDNNKYKLEKIAKVK